MKNNMLSLILCSGLMLLRVIPAVCQPPENIDPAALIQRILAVEQEQLRDLKDVVFETEYIEGETKNEGFIEKVRFIKRTYLKYLPDTVLFHETYLEYFKDGVLQKDEDRKKEEAKRKNEKKKRKAYDISYSMYEPFYPENRELYNIEYLGLAEDKIEDYVCHHFRVTAKDRKEGLINGDYYFEAGSFNLLRVDFSPARLVKKTMFKLNELNMSIFYKPTPEGYWLPKEFHIKGKGRAVFFIGVNFSGREYYRKPIINGGIDDRIFEVDKNVEEDDS